MLLHNKKIAILLICGFNGSILDYGNLNNELQFHKNFDVFTYTSIKYNSISKDDLIKNAYKLIEKIISKGYKSIYVIGQSIGSTITIHLASKYNEIKKIVLVSPTFKYLLYNNKKFDLLTNNKNKLDNIISDIFKVSINNAKEILNLINTSYNDLYNINCPIMILNGKKDNIVPIESATFIFNNNKSNYSYLVTLNNVNHDVFSSNRSQEICKLITDFLIIKHTDNSIHLDI